MIAWMWKAVLGLIVLIREACASTTGRVMTAGFAVVLLKRADAIKAALRVDRLTVLVEFVEPVAWTMLLGVLFVWGRDACSALIGGLPKNRLRAMQFDASELRRDIEYDWVSDAPSASLFVDLVTMKKRLHKLGIASPEIPGNREEWFRFVVHLQVWSANGDIHAARRQR